MKKTEGKRFNAKNHQSKTEESLTYTCQLTKAQGREGETTFELQCNCKVEDNPTINSRLQMEEALRRRKNAQLQTNNIQTTEDVEEQPPMNERAMSEKDQVEVAHARSLISELMEKRKTQAKRSGPVTRFPATAARSGRRIPEWVTVQDGVMVYRFNVFNNDPTNVNQNKLASLLKAIEKDSLETFSKDYGCRAVFDLYPSDGMKNKNLFQGDRMAIFVGKYGNGMFHYLNTTEPTNTYSFPVGGGNLLGYGIRLPKGSNFQYIPYSVISSDDVPYFMGEPDNIYAISPSTLPKDAVQDAFHQVLTTAISHEVKEILGNDTTLNWVLFDHFAPTVANWKWAEFNDPSNPYKCTNSTPIKGGAYRQLPSFLKKFPTGGLFFAVHEVGDVVSAGFAGLYDSYLVDGWLIQNHPLPTFWQPYTHDPSIQYDHMGHVEYPMEPNGGLHQLIFFISFDDAITRLIEVQNKGPVPSDMRGAPKENNFPVNYVIVRELQRIKKSTNVVALLESIENYGPSTPDRT